MTRILGAVFALLLLVAPGVFPRAALHAVDEPDFTKGSTHYHVRDMVPPRWARGKTPAFATRFHLFYNDVR